MTPDEIRQAIPNADTFKMSLGRDGTFRDEAFAIGALIYQSDRVFYEAVMGGDPVTIQTAGREVINEAYPVGGAKPAAIRIWAAAAREFTHLPPMALVIHWQAKSGTLHWGLTSGKTIKLRDDKNSLGADRVVFSHRLLTGWRQHSLAGVPLTDLHPGAKKLASNPATFSAVRTKPGFFKALILDEDLSPWTSEPSWIEKAAGTGWSPPGMVSNEEKVAASLVKEVADFFDAEAARMAKTAMKTAAYADGKTVEVTLKFKELGFAREELEATIQGLLKAQGNACALTNYAFTTSTENPHLRPSLDRIDSDQGYVPGNLQVVTRAANFYKSASGEADWMLKADAMVAMADALREAEKPDEEA